MAIEYGSRGDALLWMRNPFTGFISYVVDYDKSSVFAPDPRNPVSMPKSYAERQQIVEQAMAVCPFCPGHEAKVLSELIRVGPQRVPGWDADPATPWVIRVFNNLFPRFPTQLTGGRNESYVVVEDPRHFLVRELPPGNLVYTGALSEAHFGRLLEVCAEVVKQSLGNSSVKCVVVRKNQGRESGASQPHIHQQIVGSPVCMPAIDAELRALQSDPDLWDQMIALLHDLGLIIDRDPRVISYASPISTFPQSYDVVMPLYRGMLNQLDSEGLRRFGRAIHRLLRFLGPLPLEYEIHQAEGLPLHAHINIRQFPYATLAGTFVLSRRILQDVDVIRRVLASDSAMPGDCLDKAG
jgi:galactose-1-phosphate uridylyltransferase